MLGDVPPDPQAYLGYYLGRDAKSAEAGETASSFKPHRGLPDLRGPGRIVLQTLPFSRLADRIIAAAPAGRTGGGASGTLGSLGRLIGDE